MLVELECLMYYPNKKQTETISQIELEIETAYSDYESKLQSSEAIVRLQSELEAVKESTYKFKVINLNMSEYSIYEWTEDMHKVQGKDTKVISAVLKDKFGQSLELTIKSDGPTFRNFINRLGLTQFSFKEVSSKDFFKEPENTWYSTSTGNSINSYSVEIPPGLFKKLEEEANKEFNPEEDNDNNLEDSNNENPIFE